MYTKYTNIQRMQTFKCCYRGKRSTVRPAGKAAWASARQGCDRFGIVTFPNRRQLSTTKGIKQLCTIYTNLIFLLSIFLPTSQQNHTTSIFFFDLLMMSAPTKTTDNPVSWYTSGVGSSCTSPELATLTFPQARISYYCAAIRDGWRWCPGARSYSYGCSKQ